MRVKVDPDLCIGCGICEGQAPDVYSLANGAIAEVIADPVPVDLEADARQAAIDCPEAAIEVDEAPCEESAISEEDVEVETTIKQVKEESSMKAVVDKDLCIGCGICEGVAPDVFSLAKEPYAEVLVDPIPEDLQADTKQAAEDCPEAAISIEE